MQPIQLLTECAVLVQLADQIDVARAHGVACQLLADHLHQLDALIRWRQPPEIARQRHHPGPDRRLVGIACKVQVPQARRLVVGDLVQRPRDRRSLAHEVAQRRGIFLDMVEEHAHFRHLAAHELMDKVELLRRRQAIVGEMTDVAPEGRVRIRILQTGADGHGARRKKAEQLRTCAAGADLATRGRLKIAIEDGCRRRPQRRFRGKAIDDRNVLEDSAHPVAIAFAVPFVQHEGQALGVRRRVSGTDQTPLDLGRRTAHRFRVQRVAAEEIDLLQLREQSGARVAAGGPLHLVDGQKLARVQPVRVKLVAAIEVAGDDQQVAVDAFAARRGQPIRATALHQLHEIVFVRAKVPAEHFPFVGRIDGDRAHRLLVGVSVMGPRRDRQRSQ